MSACVCAEAQEHQRQQANQREAVLHARITRLEKLAGVNPVFPIAGLHHASSSGVAVAAAAADQCMPPKAKDQR